MNRFTEQLLTIETNEFGFYWSDLCAINELLYAGVSDMPTPSGWHADIAANKLTLICLLAALSDEDLRECFGV